MWIHQQKLLSELVRNWFETGSRFVRHWFETAKQKLRLHCPRDWKIFETGSRWVQNGFEIGKWMYVSKHWVWKLARRWLDILWRLEHHCQHYYKFTYVHMYALERELQRNMCAFCTTFARYWHHLQHYCFSGHNVIINVILGEIQFKMNNLRLGKSWLSRWQSVMNS